ncbi:hypothetical protein N7922_18980 [Kosakonia sp. ML.JS2a]|uniref:hypothetical protein n=1 Tax=Kosakonia sp. ML.JS2a TaxID=2980557 RepID=UPI0021D84757|nr:hypothetical protein [Kosakonia sp. ML.JS2a]UXY09921.1 hypothetical protein N7922_18980 [Kosakonia sp. ML.JS2a]
MKYPLVVVIAAATLVGCATQKPTIPYQNYRRIAVQEVAANKCAELGYMDFQVAAAAKNFAAQDLNSWTYDPVVYRSVFATVAASAATNPPGKSQCDAFSVSVIQRNQQQQQAYQQQQLALQQQQQINQSMQTLQSTMPKTTYCNKIGWQTVCNTY